MTKLEGQILLARTGQLTTADCAGRRESDLHDAIVAECKRRGWIYFHGSMAHRTRRTIGEPDFCILIPGGRVLMIECKSAKGKIRPEQAGMIYWAQKLGHVIHVVRSVEEFLEIINK
ncbi:MAG: VRR-NUC domain-containing protein [Patescibacteria group bacterium]|nr:VRR-NUC domain-containing protein [Patescibacteria group bacterium]